MSAVECHRIMSLKTTSVNSVLLKVFLSASCAPLNQQQQMSDLFEEKENRNGIITF